MLKLVCKELGVELEEEWIGNDGKRYMIEEDYIIEYYEPEESSDTDYDGWVVCGDEVYSDILRGKLFPLPGLKDGEAYYSPYINAHEENSMWMKATWGQDRDYDFTMLKSGFVFNTREDAIKCSKRLIAINKVR